MPTIPNECDNCNPEQRLPSAFEVAARPDRSIPRLSRAGICTQAGHSRAALPVADLGFFLTLAAGLSGNPGIAAGFAIADANGS
jgi:hypothetical protein